MQTKSLSKGGIIAAGLGIGMQIMTSKADYKRARKQGDTQPVAAAKALGTFVFTDMLGKYFPIYMAATTGYGLMKAAGINEVQNAERYYEKAGKFGSGYVPMTEAGYTMRQRSLNAIRQNGLNMQAAIGNEARQFYGRW